MPRHSNALALVKVFFHSDPIIALVIGRIVGLFVFPFGVVLGYFA